MPASEPNIIDVLWVLSEETGMLMWDSFEVVAKAPKQRVLVMGREQDKPIGEDLLRRYARITEDRKVRGIADG